MLMDLGVDTRKNTPIDKAMLKVRIDASAGRGTARSWENLAHCHSNIVGAKAHTRRQSQNHPKSWSAKPSRSQILERNTLTEGKFEEHWRGVTGTFVKGLESRCGQKCEKNHETTS